MTVFVTGGGGFLGRHLVAALEADDVDVQAPTSAQVDLTDRFALQAMKGESYEQIFHLAAWTRAGRFCQERAGEQWVVNQLINTHVVEWWQSRHPEAKLIGFGTSASYAGTGAHAEPDYMAGEPPSAYYAYAMSKRMLLAGLRSAESQLGLTWLYLVPSTIYGAGYHTDGRDLHFVYDIARKILRARRYGEPVRLWGDGSERRELLHVDDAVALTRELARKAENEVVNLGAGRSWSIREIAQEICALADFPFSEISFEPALRVGEREKVLSCKRLAELVGEQPWTIDLAEGLAELVGWTDEHLDELGQ